MTHKLRSEMSSHKIDLSADIRFGSLTNLEGFVILDLKCSKTCYFAHFSLENSNSRAITHALTNTPAPVAIIIFSVTKMKLENKLCPHRSYGFQIIAP